jgi:Transglycosylase SLT domain
MPTVPTTGDPESEAAFKANPPGARPTDFIDKHAQRVGIDPMWLRKIMRVESAGNPNAVTGSYHGLFQLSRKEFTKHGGSGDIHDPEQNTMAAANKIAAEKTRFEQKHGRTATLPDIYGIHQQGEAGYDAHLANPDKPAWENVRKYYSSDYMAKKAIWGNMTPAMKAKYGSVENVKSGDFTSDWASRVSGEAAAPISSAMGKSRARHEGIPADAGEPKPKKPEEEYTPGFEVSRVIHPDVGSPDIHFGGPVSAPLLSRARKGPQ